MPELHSMAERLQSHGRGDDSVLIHMTPGEVGGLRHLALASGGDLTINPHTGLPEAGFLGKMLPMIAGLAASFIPGLNALVAPWVVPAVVGAGVGVAKGDLMAGLMAGLGAYGGGALGGAIQGLGANTLATGVELAGDTALTTANVGADVAANARTDGGPPHVKSRGMVLIETGMPPVLLRTTPLKDAWKRGAL